MFNDALLDRFALLSICWLEHTMSKDAPGEDEEEDGVSEAASLEEPKEEDQGEGYLSEMDNEPPVSESDDGFSIHNATLQSHTLADSIPSSPASSQLWVLAILSLGSKQWRWEVGEDLFFSLTFSSSLSWPEQTFDK